MGNGPVIIDRRLENMESDRNWLWAQIRAVRTAREALHEVDKVACIQGEQMEGRTEIFRALHVREANLGSKLRAKIAEIEAFKKEQDK